MLKASIDIGSNSVLLLIGEWKDSSFELIHSQSTITALGRGLPLHQEFDEQSQQDTYAALKSYKELALQKGVLPPQMLVVATEAARVAKNAPLFFTRIKETLGLTVTIITSDAESYYSTMGVFLGEKNLRAQSQYLVIDLGGGSTEFNIFRPDPFELLGHGSYPFGCVRFPSQTTIPDLRKMIEPFLMTLKDQTWWNKSQIDDVFGMAGTVTSIMSLINKDQSYRDEWVQGKRCSLKELHELLNEIENLTPMEILTRYPTLGKRSESLRVGVALLWIIGDNLGIKEMKVSTFGARYALIKEVSIPHEFIYRQF